MKPLHVPTALLGLAIGALALVAMAQSPAPIGSVLRVEYVPHPRDYMRIPENQPFTVPDGSVFYATGITSETNGGWEYPALVVGTSTLYLATINNSDNKRDLRSLGITARGGETVRLDSPGPYVSHLYGYLARE